MKNLFVNKTVFLLFTTLKICHYKNEFYKWVSKNFPKYLIKTYSSFIRCETFFNVNKERIEKLFKGEKTFKVLTKLDKYDPYIISSNEYDAFIPYDKELREYHNSGKITNYDFKKGINGIKSIIIEMENIS